MSAYVYIPITALGCYIFLLLTFLAAKKNKIIESFLIVLITLIFWTGGSFCMRMQLLPSIKFWYDISIIGLTSLSYALFSFVQEFVSSKDTFFKRLWLCSIVLINVINIFTGAFIKCPEVIKSGNNEASFVYTLSWSVIILYLVCSLIFCHILYVLYINSKTAEITKRQFEPIILGIIILFIGHIGILVPFFKGFPTDILSGIFNAFFLFYAIYKRRLFKLTLLISRGICYASAILLSIFVFFYLTKPLKYFLTNYFTFVGDYDVLIIAVLFAIVMYCIYFIVKQFIDHVFIKETIVQADNLKQFSLAVSKSLHINEILEQIVDIIQKTINVKRVYVCITNSDEDSFIIAHSTSPLDKKTFCMKKDNPIVIWLTNNDDCILMKDFRRTIVYKSMWEEEKKQLTDLNIECFVPLKDDKELVGIVLLSGKENNRNFSFDDISFLSSVNSIGFIAVKNSKLYEKAYLEARTDELTGLLNRKYFYEIIQREFEENKEHSLALVILNIDDFKLYNQLYGNKSGDIALQKVAQIIQASVGNSGYVARYSGKEFAIILPLYDIYAAKNLAETIRMQILNMNKCASDYALKVLTVSGGICSIPHAANNVKQLIDNADMAVFHAKRRGKNIILVYSVNEKAFEQNKLAVSENKVDIYSEYASTIYALTAAINAKDKYTFNHSKNVTYYATKLAIALGMSEEFVETVREAALLHDIGKIGISEHILNKPGKLTKEEYNVMKTHVENSIGIIRHLPSLDYVIPAVIGHHEHYDGSGYPRKIFGEDIPLSARILCIADSFDAMISQRSYKESYSVNHALEILEEEAGLQFDPKLVNIFINLIKNGVVKTDVTEEMF